VLRHNDIDLNLSQRQSVAQRDEVRCLLRSLDPGKPSSREDVPLCDLIFCDQIERLALEPNPADGNSSPLAHRFGRDIHHLFATIERNVREPFHFFIFKSEWNEAAFSLRKLPLQHFSYTSRDKTRHITAEARDFLYDSRAEISVFLLRH